MPDTAAPAATRHAVARGPWPQSPSRLRYGRAHRANNRRWIWGRNAKRETRDTQPLKPLGGGELRSLQTVRLRRLIARCQQPRSFYRRMENEGAMEASLRATRLRQVNSQRSVSEKDKRKDRNIVAVSRMAPRLPNNGSIPRCRRTQRTTQ